MGKGRRAKSPQGRIVGPECVSSGRAVPTQVSCVSETARTVHGSTVTLIALCCISGHRLKSFSPNDPQDASLGGVKGRGAVAAGVGGSVVLRTPGRRFCGVSVWCNKSWLRLRAAQALQWQRELAQHALPGLGFLPFPSRSFRSAIGARSLFLPAVSDEIMRLICMKCVYWESKTDALLF